MTTQVGEDLKWIRGWGVYSAGEGGGPSKECTFDRNPLCLVYCTLANGFGNEFH
jgi:hypothetical protein